MHLSAVTAWMLAVLFFFGNCRKDASPPSPATPEPKHNDMEAPGHPPPEGMVWIPGGTFSMGAQDAMFSDALPRHPVVVDGFWIDATEVTNQAFERFVAATGYVTIAERRPNPEDFPGVPPEKLVPGSVAFDPPNEDVPLYDHTRWWRYLEGANWRHPEGPGSSIAERMQHPVVHIAWFDAEAYCRWENKRLPTEAEWERAARGGLHEKRYPWGDELVVEGRWMANVWQGRFPTQNLRDDGYLRTAPVATYPPNAFGLYDVAGNVWEWCADWYRPDTYGPGLRHNPTGPPNSFDPNEPGTPKRVMRGGSFLCSDLYCVRYAVGARGKGAPDTGASHIGFRCARSGDAPRPH